MPVHIKIESGKSAVTITVSTESDLGGKSLPDQGNLGTVTQQHNLGIQNVGGGPTVDTSTGGGAPGSSVLVVGPIVVSSTNSADSGGADSASAGTAGASGGGPTVDTSTGGAAMGSSGVLVIGPIVVCCATANNPATTQEITTPVTTTPVAPEKP
jgi:hypothetical protein